MGDGAIHASSAGYLTAVQEVSAAISSELSESGAESLKELAGTDLKMNSGTSAASEKSGAVNLKGFADANASKDSSPSTGSEKADTDNLTRFIETVPSKDSSVYTGSEKPDSGNLKGFADGDPSKDSGVSIGSEGADKDGLKRFMNSDSRSDSGVSMDSEEAYAPKQTAILETVRQNPLPIKEEAAVKDLFDTQLLQTQSNRDPVSKSISNAATDDSDTPEPTASSPDLSASEKNESHSTIAKKSERIVPASAVSVNTAESRTDQNQANHESYSRSAMQSKHETGQTSAHGKPQAMSAENKQEFHITAVSNPVQSSETGAAAFIATESASKYQSRDFIQKLADQIQVQVRDGKEEIRIQLKPDLLGRIEIRAETTLSGVTARITTESAAVKGYLENNLQLLQQTLVDLGLRLDRIQIVAQDGMDAQFSSGYGAHFGQAGTGRNGQNSNAEAEIPGFITMDAADEITLDSATRLALNPNGRFYTVA
jgi:flagellar hook-length control protein FliK